MRFPLIDRLTSAFRSFLDPNRSPTPAEIYGPPQPPAPLHDEIRTDQYIPPNFVGPLDLENDGRETDEIRRAFREFHRREPSFRTAIDGKVAAVACLDVAVIPEDKDNPLDQRAAEFAKWTIERTPHGWDGLIAKVLRPALIDGWSVSEKICQPIGYHAKWAGLWGLKAVKSRDSEKLRLRLDVFRNVAAIVSRVRGLVPHDPRKVILFTHNDLFENPFGQSDSRAVYRACSLIEDAYKLWAAALKVYSGPFLKGKVKDPLNRKAMEAAVKAGRAGGWIVTPAEDEVDLLNLASATSFDAFEKKVNKLREEVFLSIRGSYLPFLQGNGTGSDSRGDSKIGKMASNDAEYLLAKAVGRCLSHQLVPDLVIPNFGPTVGMPQVVLGGVNWAETQAQLNVAKSLLNDFHQPISAAWLYHVSQIPPPTDGPDGEDAVKPSQAAIPGGPFSPSNDTDPGGMEFSQTPQPVMVPTVHLHRDPGRFQWRPDTDPITGVERDRPQAEYDADCAEPLGVWLDPSDGRVYVVDGHHALDMAKRAGVERLPVEFLDAVTGEDAARLGMRRNFSSPGQRFRDGPPGPPPRPGLVWKNETHRWINPRTQEEHDHVPAAKPASGIATKPSPAGKPKNSQPEAAPPGKAKATRGEMHGAKVVGMGKDRKVVMADGSPAPDHIKPAMIQEAWTDVKVSLDPKADVAVVAMGPKSRTNSKMVPQTVYSDNWATKAAATKFARIEEGLRKSGEMYAQNLANLNDPKHKESAAAVWLMQEQATRPGSDEDTKGVEHLYGKKMTKDMVVENAQLTDSTGRGMVSKDGKPMTTALAIKVGQHVVPIRDQGTRERLLAARESGDLHDTGYWMKSHGATTIEGRHIVKAKDGVRLQFVGKEGVWHDHLIHNPDLANMLLERKKKAGNEGQLFDTDYAKVVKYTKENLDGGAFTPKDFRTMAATQLAISAVKMTPAPTDEKSYKATVQKVGETVSKMLGNRWQQAVESYIAPEVFSSWRANIGKPT